MTTLMNKQECIPVGCVPSTAVAVSGGGCLPGGGGVVCLGGCLPRRGVHLHHPPTVGRMTDACGNITFPQLLLRTVITNKSTFLFLNVVWGFQSTRRE